MGSVRVVRGGALSAGPVSQSVSRKSTALDQFGSIGEVRNRPQTTTGWHHHGEHTACVYVVQGPVRIEWGAGGRDSADLASGDFYVISPNTIHREANLGSEENCWVGFLVGSGAEVVNVDGPEPMSKEPKANKKPLELTIKITVGRKDPDDLARLLIKQREELSSMADSVEYIPSFPMDWMRKTGF